jgi:hypothetical protein
MARELTLDPRFHLLEIVELATFIFSIAINSSVFMGKLSAVVRPDSVVAVISARPNYKVS